MHKQKSFPLRIPVIERRRAQRLAQSYGLSENRFYADLIQEGILMREQMAHFEKLRSLNVSADEGLALLDMAPDVSPATEDRLPVRHKTTRKRPTTSA